MLSFILGRISTENKKTVGSDRRGPILVTTRWWSTASRGIPSRHPISGVSAVELTTGPVSNPPNTIQLWGMQLVSR
jgi:hypothetical protein